MAVSIEPAELSDLSAIVDLLIEDARQRQAEDQVLWKLAADARTKVTSTLKAAMENENPPFREQWLLARAGEKIVGLAHTVLLPVPPIYAGEFGPPGLIMQDSYVSKDAPEDTYLSLLTTAETDLIEAGAKVLLASSAQASPWAAKFLAQNYEPLTLYLAKTDLMKDDQVGSVRAATEADVPAIVKASNTNRKILFGLDAFWKPHADANPRFRDWMAFSLELPDRDMFVSDANGDFEGYIVSQPVTPLHIPASHDLGQTGIIDDYFHSDFKDPEKLKNCGSGAADLLKSAEAALKGRGCNTILVVCPAAWKSKIQLLESADYKNAITWFKKQ